MVSVTLTSSDPRARSDRDVLLALSERCFNRRHVSCIGVDVTLRVVLLYAAVTVGGVDGASQDGKLPLLRSL